VGKELGPGQVSRVAGGAAPDLRIYLTGRVMVEHGYVVRDEALLPGRQGRLLFCFLVLNQGRPLARHELVNAIWGDGVPDAVDASLNALISKLRRFLNNAGLNGAVALEASFGSYRLQLPTGSWVDIEQAELSFHEAEAAPVAGGGTVLVVEDADDVREVIERILTANGYKVMLAASGPDALELLRSTKRQVDVLLTDVVMPRMQGGEVAERVRELQPRIRVLYMSGYAQTGAASGTALEQILEKPFTEPDLLAKIHQVLQGSGRGS
jgi:CheY-like chemotaxis protein